MISKPILVSPNEHSSETSPVVFAFDIPSDSDNNKIHSFLQIATDIDFNNIEVEIDSLSDSFEYWNGSSWQPYPNDGVSDTYYGNQARVTVILSIGTKYWRVKGGIG